MKIYRVGGAVRDKLLGLPVIENDYVVVGATVAEMLQLGFRPVGKDFPVFLHPDTNEEYALARTERKISRGYRGFDFNAAPNVSLQEDLQRRDLTINAMAETLAGELIDPYHGKEDLAKKLLKHVSPAFSEDPVRILRIARFAARFKELGFTVAQDTNQLMKKMVIAGEVDALVPERVWKELERALKEKNPEQFFEVLESCHALPLLFPQINQEGRELLKKIAPLTSDAQIRLAALTYNLSEKDCKNLMERYRIPSEYKQLALLVCRFLQTYAQLETLSSQEILDLLQNLDAFRREERFKKFILVCDHALQHSRGEKLLTFLQIAKQVNIQELINAGFTNQALAEKIKEKRIVAIQQSMHGE